MAMESLESLQAYLQGLMNLGGTTTAGRPGVQALFTAMDGTVYDINGVYTTLPECKRQYDDALSQGGVDASPSPSLCGVLTTALAQIDAAEDGDGGRGRPEDGPVAAAREAGGGQDGSAAVGRRVYIVGRVWGVGSRRWNQNVQNLEERENKK